MAYTHTTTGITITSGIEELSDMAGVSSGVVTVDDSNWLPIYTISQRIIADASTELKISTKGIYNFPNIARSVQLGEDNGTGATLIIGSDTGDNSLKDITIQSAVTQGLIYEVDEGIFDFRGASVAEIYGLSFYGRSGLGFGAQPNDNGTLKLRNIYWDNTDGDGDFIRILGADWDSVNTHFKGASIFPARGFTQFKGAIVSDVETAITMNWGGDCQHLNLPFEGLTLERVSAQGVLLASNASQQYGSVIELLNSDSLLTGTENIINPRAGTWNSSRSVGSVVKTSDISVIITDFETSNLLDFNIYAIDTDSGNRTVSVLADNTVSDQDGSVVRHHYDESIIIDEAVVGGVYTGKIYKAVYSRPKSHYDDTATRSETPLWDLRLPIDYGIFAYGYIAKTGQITGNVSGEQELVFGLDRNLDIVEQDKTVVDARTTTDSEVNLFEAFESWRADNYKGSANPFISADGNVGDYDVVVLQTGDAFSFDGTTITINSNSFGGNITTTGLVTDAANVIVGDVSDSEGDSVINITTPAGYDNEITVYASLADAEAQTNILKTSASIRYQSSVYGGMTLFFRTEQADGTPAIGSQLIPTEAGVYEVNVATTSEGAALGVIEAIANKLDAMIEVVNGEQVFKSTVINTSEVLVSARDHARSANAQTQIAP